MKAVHSFVGLHNSGNTCFLAAGTHIAIGVKEVAQLVSQKYHNSFCAKEIGVWVKVRGGGGGPSGTLYYAPSAE